MGFCPQTQNLELQYVSIFDSRSERVKVTSLKQRQEFLLIIIITVILFPITLPGTVKPQLKWLLMACWSIFYIIEINSGVSYNLLRTAS